MEAAIEQYAPMESRNDTPDVSLALPFNLQATCLHMQVRSGSKAKSLVQFVQRKMCSTDLHVEQMTWNAFGDGIAKAIACAEMTKRRLGIQFYEFVQIGYKRVEQVWEPVNAKVELDTLKVNKDIPAICILLSKIPLTPKSNQGEH